MARVVGKVPMRLNPVGRVGLLRFKSAVPRLLIVKVLVRVLPTVVLPKLIVLRVPSVILLFLPSNISISGAGMSLSVMSMLPVVVVPKIMPLEGLEIVNVPVSVGSTSKSSLILTVNEPVV